LFVPEDLCNAWIGVIKRGVRREAEPIRESVRPQAGVMSLLTFDESGHRYYLGGVPMPNVTAVLERAGLIDYSFLGARREEYLERGKAVHLATQRNDEGGLAEDSVPEQIHGYLEAWRRFRDDFHFVPSLIEHRVYHPQHRFAGTLDRAGKVRDGTEIILDLKSGVAPAAVRYQLAVYASCLTHPRTRRRRCVELHGNGTYRVIPYETSDYQRDFHQFLRALETFRAKEERWFPR
jgi:hypothetical protein